ncbi:MAG: hypothetical protein EBT98_07100 [Opitutaceae bacterium]|nr:hypothetical protein [Opitutaceae bacterium]
MRRPLAIFSLGLAWLCANGALWNVVQVVGWAKMFHDYAQVMPASQALAVTFDGSAACDLCHVSQTAQDAAREQLPRDAALGGGMDKLLLLADSVPTLVVAAPDFAWPSVIHNIGLTRTEMVPVTPPRV